jgi:putative hydrolase of the HAD superfamily
MSANSPAKHDVKLVCFDLGGVLVRICNSWTEACAAAGLPVRRDSNSHAATQARKQLIGLYGTGKISEREWAERLSVALSGSYTPDELLRVHQAWSRQEYADVVSIVDTVHDAGLETACLSNTNHSHWRRLVHHDGQSDLEGEPEYRVVLRIRRRFASHIEGFAKPDPRFYRALEAATGFAGRQILFFDDITDNIRSARGLGWNAHRIEPTKETAPQIRAYLRDYAIV